MQAHLRLAHFAFDLGFRREGRDRVDDHDIDGAGAHQHVGDFERLLAGVRLRDQQIVNIYAEFSGIGWIERVLGIDEGRNPAGALHFRDDLQGKRRLARGLRTKYFNHASARQAAHTERDVESQRARRHGLHIPRRRSLAEAHDCAFAELLLDLAKGCGERLLAIVFHLITCQILCA